MNQMAMIQLPMMMQCTDKGSMIRTHWVASHQLVHIKGWRRYSFFYVFKTIPIVSLRRDEMLTWLIFHLFGKFI